MTTVHVSVDMEGIAGVATRSQVRRGSDDYPAARRAMTGEANAAIAGAFDGGADRVIVSDAHGDMANLLPVELDERAELLFGSPKVPWGMMAGIDGGADVCAFVGYHASAGTTNATLEHTYSSATFTEVEVNGARWSEAHLNATIAGSFGVPVALIAGDDVACAQASELLPGIRTVVTKRAIGRTVVASLHPATACERIRAAMAEAVRGAGALVPFRPAPPFALRCSLLNSGMAEVCVNLPGTRRVSSRTVEVDCPDIMVVKQSLACWIALATTAPA